jgi:hypothetical protein
MVDYDTVIEMKLPIWRDPVKCLGGIDSGYSRLGQRRTFPHRPSNMTGMDNGNV